MAGISVCATDLSSIVDHANQGSFGVIRSPIFGRNSAVSSFVLGGTESGRGYGQFPTRSVLVSIVGILLVIPMNSYDFYRLVLRHRTRSRVLLLPGKRSDSTVKHTATVSAMLPLRLDSARDLT